MALVLRSRPPRTATTAAAVPPPPRLPAEGAWCCDGDDDGVPATACLPAPGGWRQAWTTAAGALLAVAAAALVGLALGSLTAPAHANGSPWAAEAAMTTAPATPGRMPRAAVSPDFWPRWGAPGLQAS